MGKMLNESVVEKVEKIYESSNVKVLDVDAIKTLLESDGAEVQASRLNAGIKMMQLQEKYINESNVSANIQPFTKKLQPLLRRVIPNTLAFDIAGVQPVESPDSAVYAIKSKYAGSKTNPISNNAKLLTYTAVTALVAGDTITSAGGATGTVKYVETFKTEAGVASERAVIEVTAGTFVNGELFDKGVTYAADANDNTITGIYSTESAFKQILEKYAGPYTTAAGEALGDAANEIKVVIEKLPVSVETRALRANFTQELVQDMAAMHGAEADKEIMTFLSTEMVLDLDRTIISKYKEVGTATPNYVVNTYGRWSMEQYSGLYQRILKDANDLALKNRRGKGNILVATSGVISALEAVGSFKTVAYEQSVKTGENQAQVFVGVLKNGMKVYQDFFSSDEYYMTIYRGESAMDSGIFYAPFIPAYFVDAIDAKTLQPVIGIKSREGIVANTLIDDEGGSSYCSLRVVDFISTPISD